jgi:hypothetical protein
VIQSLSLFDIVSLSSKEPFAPRGFGGGGGGY